MVVKEIAASITELLSLFETDPEKLLKMGLDFRDFTSDQVATSLKDNKGSLWHGGGSVSDVLDLIKCLNELLSLCIRACEHNYHILFIQWDA